MIKSVATGILITYVMILFGYGVATASHEFLHAIENQFHTHGQVHENEQDQGHEAEHEHNDVQHNEGIELKHDHNKAVAANNHNIEDHTSGFDKMNGQDVSSTETLNPLFVFVYAQSKSIIENAHSNLKLSETEHHYASLYKSLRTEPVTPPPSSLN
ncbi:hypothetical protein ACV07N_02585 [Roseivirga echinicomitans]